MPKHQKPRDRATVPTLAVGDRVAYHSRRERREGTIVAVDASGPFPRFDVKLDDGALINVRGVSLEFMPTDQQVRKAAEKIKRKGLAAKRKSVGRYPAEDRPGNPKTADVVFCRRIND